MPKEGYVTITVPGWVLDCMHLTSYPGDDNVDILRKLLIEKLGEVKCLDIYNKWRKRNYPLGGNKPWGK
ncbi:hypothetical protein LCGC14_0380680 [marine sediment metagenome]|uniref:Uncharacterized protein n=1 Tax=marine sediment metagenome TaxID=412755 RepID=A0A0F9TKN4_9ZZZZ